VLLADVQLLCCVDCRAELRLQSYQLRDTVIEDGMLVCTACNRAYPIVDQVGIFFRRHVLSDYLTEPEMARIRANGHAAALESSASPDEGHARQLAACKNWEYQWLETLPFGVEDLSGGGWSGPEAFWNFIPIDPAAVEGKIVFASCVGRGREVYHLSKAKPARIIANEIGSEIYAVRELVRGMDHQLLLLRSDVTYLPLKEQICDVAICDHALQHVFDHQRAFATLAGVTRSAGLIGICVYSREHNWIMTGVVEPAKRLLRHVPLTVLQKLAFAPGLALYCAIHFFYVPLSKLAPAAARRLPLHDQMLFWYGNSFKVLWQCCFDFLHAPISHHFTRAEMEALATENGLEILRLTNTHSTTWSLVAQRA